MYWTATNVPLSPWRQQAAGTSVGLPVLHGSALVTRTEMRLNINLFSLTLGFVTSLVLLITTAVLIKPFSDGSPVGVGTTGILPNMWMAYRHPQLRSLFLQVVEPTTDNLRAIGMVEMKLAEDASISETLDKYHLVSSNES